MRVFEPIIGIVPPVHLIVTAPTSTAIVIESTDGAVKLHDAPLGVMTDSPSYDRHMTSLRNDVNLSAVAIPTKKIEDMNFAPRGGGSGMIGLPGDFAPPSRFIRTAASSKSASPINSAAETFRRSTIALLRTIDIFDGKAFEDVK